MGSEGSGGAGCIKLLRADDGSGDCVVAVGIRFISLVIGGGCFELYSGHLLQTI
jgi:hypothetical protein